MLSLLLMASLAHAAGKATASSFATDSDGKHVADAAFDGLLANGWGEGEMGAGNGAWLELDLGAPTQLENLSLWPGNLKGGAKSFKEYGRPKLIQLVVDGKNVGDPIRLLDEVQRRDIPLDVNGRVIRIQILEAYEGYVFADTYVAEVAVNFTEGERGKAVKKVEDWRASPEGQKALAAFEEQVVAAYDKHKADSDDMESMAFLMAAAADGPEYLRKKVTSLVPIGYRAAAIVPDQKAMDAIRKLKDPNGIPGLEMAALRAIGRQQKEINEIVEMFYAYAELLSGGRRNIKAWGEEGWEPGAFRSFEEPLALEVDRYGDLYVVDTGNNRLQRFNQDGAATKQWGLKADIANQWFGRTRKWYASGAGPSEEKGGFVNPVDVELIPGKDGDGFAVLDATGRVQVFDENGNPVIGWKFRTDDEMQPKIGGSGYLAWVEKKKQLVVVIGQQGATYNLESEQLKTWKIKDGTPNAVEAGTDGRLYMIFQGKLIAYNPDGFRYGEVGDSAVFGEGFEDADLTKDEKGRLWVLTDTGWLFNFKKPGKLDWKLQVSDYPLEHPRLAVSQGLLFVTDRNRIMHIDALQKHLDEVEAAADAAAASGGTDDKKKK